MDREPFTITTTIVTTIDPSNPEGMLHAYSATTTAPVEFPDHLIYGVSQAACEMVLEGLMEHGIGVEGELVEDAPAPPATTIGDVYDAEFWEVPAA